MANEIRLFRLKPVGAAGLLKDEVLVVVGLLFVMIQIRFQHLFRNVTHAPRPVTDAPEVPAPVAALQLGKLLQQQLGTTSFQAPHQVADAKRRRIRYVQMNVVLADDTFENLYILRIARLPQQVAAP